MFYNFRKSKFFVKDPVDCAIVAKGVVPIIIGVRPFWFRVVRTTVLVSTIQYNTLPCDDMQNTVPRKTTTGGKVLLIKDTIDGEPQHTGKQVARIPSLSLQLTISQDTLLNSITYKFAYYNKISQRITLS